MLSRAGRVLAAFSGRAATGLPTEGFSTTLADDIAALAERYPMPDPKEDTRPIFILSVGWRSGSTALQRLLLSSKEAIVWGEPYEAEGLVQGLAGALRAVAHTPEKKNSFKAQLDPVEDLAMQWVPTFGPPFGDLIEGHRALFSTLFGSRPEYAGKRWGIKTVRLEPDYACYFRLLYPSCVPLFLIRDPYEAVASFHGSRFLKRVPSDYVATIDAFARHWVFCARRLDPVVEATGGLLVRHEEFASPTTITAVSQATGLQLSSSALEQKIGSTAKRYLGLPRQDRRTFERIVGDAAEGFGYRPPMSA